MLKRNGGRKKKGKSFKFPELSRRVAPLIGNVIRPYFLWSSPQLGLTRFGILHISLYRCPPLAPFIPTRVESEILRTVEHEKRDNTRNTLWEISTAAMTIDFFSLKCSKMNLLLILVFTQPWLANFVQFNITILNIWIFAKTKNPIFFPKFAPQLRDCNLHPLDQLHLIPINFFYPIMRATHSSCVTFVLFALFLPRQWPPDGGSP